MEVAGGDDGEQRPDGGDEEGVGESPDERGAEGRGVADVAEAGADGAGDALGGQGAFEKRERCQLTRIQMTPAKDTEFSRKTQPAPVLARLNAATMSPPMAGPTARARLLHPALRETASGMRSCGTSSGMMACQAGLFMAEPMLSRKVKASRAQGETWPRKVRTARMATEASIQTCQKMSRRRRSKMSAVAPASRPRTSTGREAAVCMRAMSSGEAVREVMSQVPAVSCIQVPTEETVLAIQRSRKRRMRRGAKPEGCGVEAAGGASGGEVRGMGGLGSVYEVQEGSMLAGGEVWGGLGGRKRVGGERKPTQRGGG